MYIAHIAVLYMKLCTHLRCIIVGETLLVTLSLLLFGISIASAKVNTIYKYIIKI